MKKLTILLLTLSALSLPAISYGMKIRSNKEFFFEELSNRKVLSGERTNLVSILLDNLCKMIVDKEINSKYMKASGLVIENNETKKSFVEFHKLISDSAKGFNRNDELEKIVKAAVKTGAIETEDEAYAILYNAIKL